MIYKAKKLWTGRVSVRDYIVAYCKKMNEPLTIMYQDRHMRVRDLADFYCDQRHHIAQRSDKFIRKGQTYMLYDYLWDPSDPVEVEYTEDGRKAMLTAWKALKKNVQERLL